MIRDQIEIVEDSPITTELLVGLLETGGPCKASLLLNSIDPHEMTDVNPHGLELYMKDQREFVMDDSCRFHLAGQGWLDNIKGGRSSKRCSNCGADKCIVISERLSHSLVSSITAVNDKHEQYSDSVVTCAECPAMLNFPDEQ